MAAPDAAGDGLVGGAAQAVLPAAGGEGKTRGRAHRRIRVAVGETRGHAFEQQIDGTRHPLWGRRLASGLADSTVLIWDLTAARKE